MAAPKRKNPKPPKPNWDKFGDTCEQIKITDLSEEQRRSLDPFNLYLLEHPQGKGFGPAEEEELRKSLKGRPNVIEVHGTIAGDEVVGRYCDGDTSGSDPFLLAMAEGLIEAGVGVGGPGLPWVPAGWETDYSARYTFEAAMDSVDHSKRKGIVITGPYVRPLPPGMIP